MAIDPGAQSSIKLWIKPDLTAYTDSGGTTPATADGDAVKNAPDQSGQANHLTRASGTGAVLRVENGVRVFEFGGGYLNRDVTSGSLSAFTLHFFAKMTIPVGNYAMFAFGAAGVSPFLAPSWVNGISSSYQITTSDSYSCPYATDATWRHLAFVYNGSTLRAFLDGAEIGGTVTGTQAVGGEPAVPSFTRGGYSLGKETSFGNAFQGRIAEVCYYETAQSDSLVSQFGDYFRSRFSALLNTTDKQVVWVGDSLLSNLVASQSHAIAYLVGTASSSVNRWISAGRSSITTTQMLTRVALDYSVFAVSPGPKVAVIWEGTNDLLTVSASTAISNLQSLAQSLKAAGFNKVVCGTVLPRGTDSAFETARQTVNAAIRADTANFDAVADVGADATIGVAGAQNNGTYYHGDKVHMIDAGNDVAATIFQQAIERALLSGSSAASFVGSAYVQ